ncbi:MAG: AAA family ATPase [Eubacteriales bacterium]|jgi:pilus assembly protein CpaE|nr:AAA family ATPase [Eubacteriales bacterium]
MNSIRIMLAATSADDRKMISGLLTDEALRVVSTFRPDNDGLKKASSQPADVLLIGTRMMPEQELDFAERIFTTRSDITIILIAPELDSRTLARAMECGIARVINLDSSERDICAHIMTAASRDQNRRNSTQKIASYDSKIVVCYAPKGGVGKTTLAVNLAYALASMNKKIALIDLSLQFGEVGVFLDIPKGDTIADMVEEHSFELSTIKSYLIRHQSGIQVMLSSSSPEYAELIRPEHIDAILSSLRTEFDFIVVDMGVSLGDCAIAAMETADTILLVVNEDIASLHDAKRSIKVLEALNQQDKIKIVVNKDGISTITVKNVANLLESTPVLVIPYDLKSAMLAVNRGIPMLSCAPNAKAAKEIRNFARSLIRRV